jgi:hypothetical protein
MSNYRDKAIVDVALAERRNSDVIRTYVIYEPQSPEAYAVSQRELVYELSEALREILCWHSGKRPEDAGAKCETSAEAISLCESVLAKAGVPR